MTDALGETQCFFNEDDIYYSSEITDDSRIYTSIVTEDKSVINTGTSHDTAKSRTEEEGNKVHCFRSLEEAYSFIRNYEIASNNKFVCHKKRHIDVSDITSFKNHRLSFDVNLFIGQKTEDLFDGILTVILGSEERACQYGQIRERCYQSQVDASQTTSKKRRKITPSKKIGCPAMIRLKKVLKFPDCMISDTERFLKRAKTKLVDKFKEDFSEQTKRYVMVYVHIEPKHNHNVKPVEKQHKNKTICRQIDKGCNRIPHDPRPAIETEPVLKRSASLRGKDLSDLALQFKTTNELPVLLARPKANLKLEDMDTQQLMTLFYEITGKVSNEIFATAEKEFTQENLILLLHMCILFANAAGHEQTHQSVRIKGMEHDFTPKQCEDTDCAQTDSHMHCPFCSKTDSYTDPSVLKQHYTKKHIDKALEFAGLKILRCYDTCDVVGKKKYNKKLDRGHWHCYKCSNAIGARHDVLLHYKTHLNAYTSTFQIHVAQDVDPWSSQGTIGHEITVGVDDNEETFTATKLEQYTTNDTCGRSPTKRQYVGTGLGDHRTVDNLVVYVEEDEMGNVLSTHIAQDIAAPSQEKKDNPSISQLKSRIRELEIQNSKLERENLLHKSFIQFLEKRNMEQTRKHKAQKEKLLAENAKLRGGTGLDQENTNNSGKVSNKSENREHKAQKEKFIAENALLRAALTSTTVESCDKIKSTKKKTSKNEQQQGTSTAKNKNSSQDKVNSMDDICDQLSGLKKEMESLKTAFHRKSTPNGSKYVVETVPIYLVPNKNNTTLNQFRVPQDGISLDTKTLAATPSRQGSSFIPAETSTVVRGNTGNSSGCHMNMPYFLQPSVGLQNTAPLMLLPNSCGGQHGTILYNQSPSAQNSASIVQSKTGSFFGPHINQQTTKAALSVPAVNQVNTISSSKGFESTETLNKDLGRTRSASNETQEKRPDITKSLGNDVTKGTEPKAVINTIVVENTDTMQAEGRSFVILNVKGKKVDKNNLTELLKNKNIKVETRKVDNVENRVK